MLVRPLARRAGGSLAADELADEAAGRPRHAEGKALGTRQVEDRHVVRAAGDAAGSLQAPVRAVVGAEQVPAGGEDTSLDDRVAERGHDRLRGAGEKGRG